MTLTKSKINSLGWLKSAIYISVVGGAILSSKAVSAASFNSGSNDPQSFSFNLVENTFQSGLSSHSLPGTNWRAIINVDERNGVFNDNILIRVLIKHLHAPHRGDDPVGTEFNLRFYVDTSTMAGPVISDSDSNRAPHGDINHFDTASGTLTANVTRRPLLRTNLITDWTLTMNGQHNTRPVPEPLTIFGAATALGYGAILKRKSSKKKVS
jgi:hypothetical protein